MRFENLTLLEQQRPPLCDELGYRRLLRAARTVRERTGALCWFNATCGELQFGYIQGNRPAIVQGIPMMRAGRVRSFDPATETMGVEDIIHAIQLAKVSPVVKARWERQWRERRQSDLEREEQEHAQETTKMAMERFRSYRRREGMGSHYKGQAVVSGLAS